MRVFCGSQIKNSFCASTIEFFTSDPDIIFMILRKNDEIVRETSELVSLHTACYDKMDLEIRDPSASVKRMVVI